MNKYLKYCFGTITVNPDGSITVDGNVSLYNLKLTELPLKFKRVTGYFNCGANELTTLEGAPEWVKGSFDCGCNKLTTLEYAPEYVGNYFYCSVNQLTSLKGAPEYVEDIFYCDHNAIPTDDLEKTVKRNYL